MKTYFAYVALLALLAPPSGHTAADDGLEGGFLGWGAGARALSLGKAFTAVADDASAAYWNPAGMVQLDRGEVTALHAVLWEGAAYDFVSVAMPTLLDGAFGFHVTMLGVGGVERRDTENNLLAGDFGSQKIAAGLSYGRELNEWLALGVSVKYLGRWLDTVQTGFVTGDVSAWSRLTPDLTFGAAIKHIGFAKFGDTDDALPIQWRVGGAYRFFDALLISAELEHTGRWHVGTELTPVQPLLLRMGADALESTAGVGVVFGDTRMDYTAALHQELGLSHRFAFSLAWGDGLGTIRIQKADHQYFEALKSYQAGKKEDALNAVNEVLALDPRHTAARLLQQRLSK